MLARRRSVYNDADATQLNSTSSCRHVHSVNNCSMNVVTQLTQFVGHDVINKNTTGCTLFNWVSWVQFSWVQLSWVELCRYKHPLGLLPLLKYGSESSMERKFLDFSLHGSECSTSNGRMSECSTEPKVPSVDYAPGNESADERKVPIPIGITNSLTIVWSQDKPRTADGLMNMLQEMCNITNIVNSHIRSMQSVFVHGYVHS